jgi:hypothetical protein
LGRPVEKLAFHGRPELACLGYNLPLYATSTSGFELRNGLHKGLPRLPQLMERI